LYVGETIVVSLFTFMGVMGYKMDITLCFIKETYFKKNEHGYVKAAKKKRHEKEPLYRESSLINFFEELGI